MGNHTIIVTLIVYTFKKHIHLKNHLSIQFRPTPTIMNNTKKIDTGPRGSDMTSSGAPQFTPYHPLIPKLYIAEWKQDMRNRDRIVENCMLSGLPYQAEDSLYLEKRERLNNVEPREIVMLKGADESRKKILQPPLHSALSKYRSSTMTRTAED